MTSERVLLYFFDTGDFFVDFNEETEGSEIVLEDRIGSITSIPRAGRNGPLLTSIILDVK